MLWPLRAVPFRWELSVLRQGAGFAGAAQPAGGAGAPSSPGTRPGRG